VRLNVPYTDEAEARAVNEVLDSGYLTQGPKAAQFEKLVGEYVGTKYAFAASSATTGIHLAVDALGVTPGSEVIMPDFSFPATANAVVQQGAIPIFVDINLATFNLDPAKVEQAITSRTKAIMPVHAFGLVADMDPINEIAARHGIPVIEDAACALSGMYHGKQAGSLGTVGVFSFHPRKIITTGEGGMVTTDDPALAEKIQILRTHGAVRGELYMNFVSAGYNYRLSDLHAAVGIAQMSKLEHIIERRQYLAAELGARLSGIEGVTAPLVPDGLRHAFQSFVVLLDQRIDRDQVIRLMKERDIETTLGTYSMHLQPYFRDRFDISDASLPNATRAQESALTLPLYPQLTDLDLDRIVEALRNSVALARTVEVSSRS
jgi:perosamine synthetase